MKIYCPVCDIWIDDVIKTLAPGTIRWNCPECEAEFDIDIGYTQLFEHDFRRKDR